MASISQKPRLAKVLYSRITLGVIVLLIVFLAMSVYERFTIERDMKARRAVVEHELKLLQERKVGLEQRVEYLSSDRGIEAEIRKHFDVAREGEQVVVLVDNERQVGTSTPAIEIEEPEEHTSVWSWLFPW